MRRLVIAYLTVAAMISVVYAQVNKADKPVSSALAISVRTDKQTYRISDSISMETQLLNVGHKDVYIWEFDLCWNFAGGLSMYVTTPNGTPAHGDVLFDCVPPPPKEGDVYAFIKLEPGRFYGVADAVKVTDIVSKPGEYDISVSYYPSIQPSEVKEHLKNDSISTLPVWMDQPTIRAPKLRIVVKP